MANEPEAANAPEQKRDPQTTAPKGAAPESPVLPAATISNPTPTVESKPVPRSTDPLQPYQEPVADMSYGKDVDGPANAALSTTSDSSQTGFETHPSDHTDDHWHDHHPDHPEYPEADYYHQHNSTEGEPAREVSATLMPPGGGGTGSGSGGSDEDEEEGGGPIKTFFEHLEDLRWLLIRVFVALAIGMTVCLAAAPVIVSILRYPMVVSGANIKLTMLGPIDGMVIAMKIALYGGITLALPFILFFIAQFVMPALKPKEQEYFRRAFTIGGGLFLIGVLICYEFVLPISIYGTVQFNEWLHIETDQWRAQEYFSFAIMFMVGMGLSFELPVVLLTLVRIGILSHEWLVKGRKIFFVVNLVVCSFITPDFFSTFFMVIPVQILMEICILISAGWERQKRRLEEKERKDGKS